MRTTVPPPLTRGGRPTGRFTQHRRLDRLRRILEDSPAGLTLEELAAAVHVTTRSIRRYLHELHRLVELESVATVPGGAHVWRIKPSERGRAVSLRRTQAFGLVSARPVFEALKGTALYDELDLALRQLLQVAKRPGRTSGDVRADTSLDRRLLVVAPPPRSYAVRAEELDELFSATAELRVVELVLRDRAGGPSQRVIAHPWALVLHAGAVQCVVFAPETGALRLVALEDVEHVASKDQTFDVPADFDVASLVHGAFGVVLHAPLRILVEFDPPLAEEIRARRLHPQQRLATARDGRVRLSLPAPSLDEACTWILGFGSAARALEPPELVARVRAALEAALARYDVG